MEAFSSFAAKIQLNMRLKLHLIGKMCLYYRNNCACRDFHCPVEKEVMRSIMFLRSVVACGQGFSLFEL